MQRRMEVERYKRIVSAIENLDLTEVQELFRLLHKNDCRYTSNNNGIFINLNWASEDLLDKIERYIYFCNQSNKEIRRYESLQDILNKKLHDDRNASKRLTARGNTQGAGSPSGADDSVMRQSRRVLFAAGAAANPADGTATDKAKVSSSMRFYLLKKRYAKQSAPTTVSKNDLTRETYIIHKQ